MNDQFDDFEYDEDVKYPSAAQLDRAIDTLATRESYRPAIPSQESTTE